MPTTRKNITVGSPELRRRVICYPSGRAVFRTWYITTFGPNTVGREERFPTQEEAVRQAKAWVAR